MDWKDTSPLAYGSASQRRVYRDLTDLNILRDLAHYDATHASSFVLGLDQAESDIDIICEANDLVRFSEELSSRYGHLSGFAIKSYPEPRAAVVANFSFQKSQFEIFGQPLPIAEQNGFRHMAQTHRVLKVGGDVARARIRELRERGHKTEPALSLFLGLVELRGDTYSADPFQELLRLEGLSDNEISELVSKKLASSM